jgi:uncharacterized protein YndB with AHSA1/START domain
MATQTIAKPSLTLKRRYKAPPAKVFAAWTDPKKIAQWFGPPGIKDVRAECEARVGGRYTIAAFSDSGEQHQVGGVYREVVANEKLVFTWAWHSTPERESLVTVTLKPDGDGTILTLTHDQFFDEPARDRHQQGWTGALDKLEKFFA